MRTARGLLTAALIAAALAGGWFLWKDRVEAQDVGRGIMYARAADEALARQATASTPALFTLDTPPPPELGTAPLQVPCPATPAQLRSDGAVVEQGLCRHFAIGVVRRDQRPAICHLAPCLFIAAYPADWSNQETRAALESLKRDPSASCRAAQRFESDWSKTKGDLAGDCSWWRWLKGPVFVVTTRESVGPDTAPPQLRPHAYRFVRLL